MSNLIGYNIPQIHTRIRHEKIRENTHKNCKNICDGDQGSRIARDRFQSVGIK